MNYDYAIVELNYVKAYVMMSFRIAYFKVYYPAAFYASFLSTKIDDFNWDIIKKGLKQVENRIIYSSILLSITAAARSTCAAVSQIGRAHV